MLHRLPDRPPPDPLFWRGLVWGLVLTASIAFVVGMILA